MRIVLLLAFCFAVFMSSCTQDKFYKTETGLLFKTYPSDSKDSIARMGSTAKVHFIQRVKDSVIESTYGNMPLYWMVMPGFGNRYNPLEVFDYGLKEGDSVVTVQIVDSMQKKGIFKTIPAWMKKEDEWITTFKVVKVFRSDSALQEDKKEEGKRVIAIQTDLSRQRIKDYLQSKKINADSIADGGFVELVSRGNGAIPDSGKQVDIHYNVVSLGGEKLSSSRDSTSNGPVKFISGSGFFPPQVEAQLKNLSAGSKVRVYLPWVVVFGPEPNSKKIKKNDDWIFEIEFL